MPALALTIACGSSVREPPTGPHSEKAPLTPVEEPPPPAKVESIPEDPGKPCVWQDGRWEWFGGTWEWKPGAWVFPPEGCYYAPPIASWADAADRGILFYRPAQWYSEKDGKPCAEPVRCKTKDSEKDSEASQ